MAKTYFLNAQSGKASLLLNAGPLHPLAPLTDQSADPFCCLGLKANSDKDTLGTAATNILVVTSAGQSDSVTWAITMTGIKPDEDIQFLVFENNLLARQGSTTTGFTISRQ